jgi:carbamoyl-phosphate synthase large subunit
MLSPVRPTNVLFASAGRRIELLRAFRKAFDVLGLTGSIITTDMDPLAPTIQVADKSYIIPRFTSPDYIPQLLEICEHEEIKCIFPLIDLDIPVLTRHAKEFAEIGAHVATIPFSQVDTVEDKWATTAFFRSLNLATPTSWLPTDPVPQDHFPLLVKPRRGSAAKNVFKVNNAVELRFFSAYVPDAIIQEFIDGFEVTSDVAVDASGEILAVVSRKRIEVRNGEVSKGKTVYYPEITEACIKMAKTLAAAGPITVQCLVKNSRPYFTEVNARLGGGVPLALAAGADIPRYILAKLANVPCDIPPIGSYRVDLNMTRFDDSFFLTESECEEIKGRTVRSR